MIKFVFVIVGHKVNHIPGTEHFCIIESVSVIVLSDHILIVCKVIVLKEFFSLILIKTYDGGKLRLGVKNCIYHHVVDSGKNRVLCYF